MRILQLRSSTPLLHGITPHSGRAAERRTEPRSVCLVLLGSKADGFDNTSTHHSTSKTDREINCEGNPRASGEMGKQKSRVLFHLLLLFLLAFVRFLSIHFALRPLFPLPLFLLFHRGDRFFLRWYKRFGSFRPPLLCNLFLLDLGASGAVNKTTTSSPRTFSFRRWASFASF